MSKHILLIDDEPDIIKILAFKLKKNGYDVGVASSGEEGCQFVKEGLRPDLFIIDYRMPGWNGLETAKEIRKLLGETFIPILFLTASTNSINVEELQKVNAQGVMNKPFEMEEIVSFIEEYT